MNSHRKQFLKRLGVTLFVIAVYQFLSHILLLGVGSEIFLVSMQDKITAMANVAISQFSVIVLGLGPYLSASIISQILSSVPSSWFYKLRQDKNLGASKLNTITKFVTIGIGIIQSMHVLRHIFRLNDVLNIIRVNQSFFYLANIPILVASVLFVIWMANKISRNGIGKGVQIIMLVNLIRDFPKSIDSAIGYFKSGNLLWNHIFILGGFLLATTVICLIVDGAIRKIEVHYTGIKTNEKQYLPIKVNYSGIMTVMLARHIMHFIPTLAAILRPYIFTGPIDKVAAMFHNKSIGYYIIYSIFIVLFTTLYSTVVFDPKLIAKELADSGQVISGVPPLNKTEKYLKNLMGSLNIISSVYIIVICVGVDFFCMRFNNWIGIPLCNISGSSLLMCIGISKTLMSGITQYDYGDIPNSYRGRYGDIGSKFIGGESDEKK